MVRRVVSAPKPSCRATNGQIAEDQPEYVWWPVIDGHHDWCRAIAKGLVAMSAGSISGTPGPLRKDFANAALQPQSLEDAGRALG